MEDLPKAIMMHCLHVDADIYCLLNSDVEVTKDWLLQ